MAALSGPTAYEASRPGPRAAKSGTMSSSRRASWPPGKVARRASSRSAIRDVPAGVHRPADRGRLPPPHLGVSRRCTCLVGLWWPVRWHEGASGRGGYTDQTRRRRWPSLDALRSGSPMAEPRAVRTAAVPVSGHDDLLATKLHLPRPRPGFVPRPRLVGRLDEGLARGLVVVCAAAGYGKTVTLADWARRSGRPVAWLSLDAGDNDPVRFWRHVVAAVGPVRPGVAGRLLPLFGPPPPSSLDGPVTALINELAARPGDGEAILILDDYHLIDAGPVHESLLLLAEHLPPGLRLVLASRSDPPLPLGRLRARGQLAELGAAELRFTAEEAAALLRRVAEGAGSALSDADLAVLAARAEGWAAGLQLAGLSLRGRADAAGFVAAFSGSHRFVLDYLTDEVLAVQPEQVRGFLLETSVLERLSGELCDAVTGRAGGQAMLEQVERAGLFLVPLDEVRGWWRYHHLFADLLRARLQRDQPGRVPALHRAAAAWHEAHGLADGAVRHAVAAADLDWAARLIEQHVETLLRHSERATLRRWLSALPPETLRARARLCMAQAIGAIVGGQIEAAEPLIDDTERAYAATPDEPYEPSVGHAISALANVPAWISYMRAEIAYLRGDTARALECNRQALAQLGDGDTFLHLMVPSGFVAAAAWLCGQLEQA